MLTFVDRSYKENPMHTDESKKYDKRIIEILLSRGMALPKDYETYLSKLPDVSGKVYTPEEERTGGKGGIRFTWRLRRGCAEKGDEEKRKRLIRMPIYEYRCGRCHRDFGYLVLNPHGNEKAACPFCKWKKVKRLLSSFSVHQTEASRLAGFDPSKPRGRRLLQGFTQRRPLGKKEDERNGGRPRFKNG